MFNPQDDPLGLGLKQRAREARMRSFAQNPGGGSAQTGARFASVLPEDFDAWFQAVGEATKGKNVRFGQESPISNDYMNDPEVYEENRALGFDQQNAPSRQLGTLGVSPALLALHRRQGRK